MTKHFTHLHLHTEYSLLDGAIRIKDLMRMGRDKGWKAVGMSDHGNIFGAVKFFSEAKKAGLKPVLGCEMYLTPDVAIKDPKEKYHHLIVIVQNREGYQNLCRLMAYSYQKGFYFKPRIDYAALEQFNKGLIVSTACVGGHIPNLFREGRDAEAEKRIAWNLQVFGKDRFFLELQPEDIEPQIIVNKKLIEYSKKMDVNCIITGDAHYLCEDDHEAHEVLLSIQTKHLLTDPSRMTFGDFRGYVKSTEHMLEQFPNHHDAVWRTGEIAENCEFDFDTGKLFFPEYPIPKEHTQDSYFKQLCQEGLDALYEKKLFPQEEQEQYQERLDEETDLIIKMGYVGYFLIVSDFIKWAKQQHIPVGPGRGSAAGSLVAWALEITNVDPIKYMLLFERFLNPERISMPDIDIDFCVERREDVINYVKDKYGQDCVCQIITFGTMQTKGVIKDVGRTLGFPFQDTNNLTNLVPDQLGITLKEALAQEPEFERLMKSDSEVDRLMNICFKLEGLTRHASKHAAGVVISPEPLERVLPLYIPSKTDELVTQYAMTELEQLGFLKMDFLGLKNLSIIDRALKAIKERHGVTIDLDTLPFDDPKTLQLVCDGKTSAIFQFESSGIKDVLVKLQPDKFEDLIAVNALYRPGPLGSGMVDDFIDRRHGRKKTTYMFPELEPILAETYGVIVYQEQVMKIASTIAGYTLGGADILRRAMGKKKVDVMAEQKEMFIAGAKKRNFAEKTAGELFDLMAYFAGYGFNKSHSTAYAQIAYHTAYLKANYPIEFMAAVLSFDTNDPDKLKFYLHEAHDMGITILPPNINTSHKEFTPTDEGIVFGLKGIKNVGGAALENILSVREKKAFKSILDFCKRVDLRCVNKRVMESLIAAGAFDQLPGYRAQKMDELERIINVAHDSNERALTGQMDLFGTNSSGEKKDEDHYSFTPRDEWGSGEKLEKEKEVVGFYLSEHPLDMYQPLLQGINVQEYRPLLEAIKQKEYKQEPIVRTVGLLQGYKVITTRKGDRMAFAQVEDLSGQCEVIVFPSVFKKTETILQTSTVLCITGSLSIDSAQQCKIKANTLIPLDQLLASPQVYAAILSLPGAIHSGLIEEIKKAFSPGTMTCTLRYHENNETLQLICKEKIGLTIDGLATLKKLGITTRFELK